MQVRVRPLNKGEVFCCGISKAKALFRETPVILDFAYYGRDFAPFLGTELDRFAYKHVQGRVVAVMQMVDGEESPLLSFKVIKEEKFSSELKKEFETKYLPEFYRLYQTKKDVESIIRKTTVILVALHDGKLKLYQTTY